MNLISTHILDTSRGCPGAEISVICSKMSSSLWQEIASKTTNSDGKILNLLGADQALNQGYYRLRFNTQDYFNALHESSFYPYIDVVFNVHISAEHYHIPLLISPYGFTTYRGQ